MKINKRLLPIFAIVLIFLAAFIAGSFSHRDQSDAREVIRSELDRLKDLDSKTTQKYISYKEMFPDATENTELSDEINNVFSLFFQKFDYKILDISVDKKSKTAEASLKLTTIDAQSLARDFATELLKTQITETAQAKSGTVKDSSKSLEGHYLILYRLLTTNTYDSTENNCTIQLINNGSGQKENWEIRRTYSLENDLVGGLMVYLSDPDILSPEDTLSVYFNTLKKMNLEEMSSYLGVLNIMNTSDSVKNSIAEALVEQVHQNFNFKIQSSSVNGYNATVTTAITTFDSNAILSNYQSSLDTYLASPDAVIDGSQKRYEKSLDFLLNSIKNNTATTTSDVDFVLINDGASWNLQDQVNTLGDAIFGTLTSSPLDEDSDSSDSDSSEDSFETTDDTDTETYDS